MKRPIPLEPLDRDVREALELEKLSVSGPDAAKARVLDRVAGTLGLLTASVASGGRGEPRPSWRWPAAGWAWKWRPRIASLSRPSPSRSLPSSVRES